MNVMRSITLASLAIFCIANSAAEAQTAKTITIGLGSASLISSSPLIARELGLFEKHGLDAKIITMESGNAATQALISKSLDVTIMGPGDLVVAQARGIKILAIANAYAGLGATLTLAKSAADKSGIGPTAPLLARVKALEGLLIATSTPTSPYTIAFKGYAQSNRIDLRFTYMAATAMTAALESGAVQATINSAPFWGEPVLKGTGVAWISGPRGELPPENTPRSTLIFGVMREYAEANPDIVQKVQAIFADFAKAIDERPNEVRAAIAKLFPTIDEKAREILYVSESPAWKTKPLTVQDIEHEILFIKQTGVSIPDLEKVKPAELLYSR